MKIEFVCVLGLLDGSNGAFSCRLEVRRGFCQEGRLGFVGDSEAFTKESTFSGLLAGREKFSFRG